MSLFRDINTESKIRLTVTSFAMGRLSDDSIMLGLKRAFQINTIIEGFSPIAGSSVSLRLEEQKQSYIKTLGDKSPDIVEKLTSASALELRSKVPVYANTPESFLVRLNNSNLFLLTEDKTSREDRYYKSIKEYVEALVEEFVRLPFVKREKIYLHKNCDLLEEALKNGYSVYISHSNGYKYLMRIHSITTDALSNYNYCIGITSDNKTGKDRIYALRLSRITNVVIRKNIPGALTSREKELTDREIDRVGVQFVSDRTNIIVVRFNDQGIKAFNTILHLRPKVRSISEDGMTYTFECTDLQALFYFTRIGPDCEILKPSHLRKRFKSWYKRGSEIYQ